MKKTAATILSLLVAAIPFAARAPLSASAESDPFSALTDVAASEDYTAVTSDNALYLFNRNGGGFWQEYIHTQTISQIAFDERGTLYFRDAHRNLYALNAEAYVEGQAAQDTSIDCGSFFLDGDALYYANVADANTLVYAYSPNTAPILFDEECKAFAYENKLYALSKSNALFELDLTSGQATLLTSFNAERTELAVLGDGIFTSGTGGLYRYDLTSDEETQLDTGAYTAISATKTALYALKNGEAYLYDGTNVSKAADEFTRPQASALPLDSLKTQMETGDTFALVQTKENALLAEVDLETKKTVSTSRTESVTALKVAETADYALLSYRASPAEDYKALVIAKTGYQTLAQNTPDYLEAKLGYTSNALSLYRLPRLGGATETEIPRGAEITLLGEINGLDVDYYKVSYDGKVGYLPKAYVLSFKEAPSTSETVVGDGERGVDGIWRMTYLILGAAAVGVLVDFLILRKKNND